LVLLEPQAASATVAATATNSSARRCKTFMSDLLLRPGPSLGTTRLYDRASERDLR
jgi:hypothetical protein